MRGSGSKWFWRRPQQRNFGDVRIRPPWATPIGRGFDTAPRIRRRQWEGVALIDKRVAGSERDSLKQFGPAKTVRFPSLAVDVGSGARWTLQPVQDRVRAHPCSGEPRLSCDAGSRRGRQKESPPQFDKMRAPDKSSGKFRHPFATTAARCRARRVCPCIDHLGTPRSSLNFGIE